MEREVWYPVKGVFSSSGLSHTVKARVYKEGKLLYMTAVMALPPNTYHAKK